MKVEREHKLVLTASSRLVAQLENNAGRLRMMDELVSLSYQHVRIYSYAHMDSTFQTTGSDRRVELFFCTNNCRILFFHV
jgi:hypothetical protein